MIDQHIDCMATLTHIGSALSAQQAAVQKILKNSY